MIYRLFLETIASLSFFLCLFSLNADWNSDFDQQTAQLIEQIPLLQNPDFLSKQSDFKIIRATLLKDKELVDKFKKTTSEDRLVLVVKKNGVILKKRKRNLFQDLHPWEISYLAGSSDYVVPSFPIEIGGKIILVQKLEEFQVGSIMKGYPPNTIETVSLEHYWKAMIQAYVLGFSDLVSPNIGINKKGYIRYFDNESCLIYRNTPFRENASFKLGFFSQAIDWPQYTRPMDAKIAKNLKEFIDFISSHLLENLPIYSQYRPTARLEGSLETRIDYLKSFEIKEGKNFQDFFYHIYPKMAPGLSDLRSIVFRILKKRVGDGTSLMFATLQIGRYKLNNRDHEQFQLWLNRYID